jgi:transcriptional regulator with XRE-family HTH domain
MMARRKTIPPISAGTEAWGPERLRLGVSLRQLEAATGISRLHLSMIERGRMIPSYAEMVAVADALRAIEAGAAA